MLIIDTPLKKIRRPLDTSKTWAENILAAHPQLLDPDFTTINLNGKRIKNRKFDCNAKPNDGDLLTICVRPQGFDPITIAIGVAIAASAVSFVLARRAMGNISDRSGKSSGNTEFTGQTNTARLYSQRPDIYGKVRAYPDLIGEALLEYVRNHSRHALLR